MRNSAGDWPDDDGSSGDLAWTDPARQDGVESTADPVGSDCAVVPGGDEGAVVAELSIEHRDAVLGDAIRAAPSVTVEPNFRTNDGCTGVLVFTASGGDLDEFDTALASDHTVRDPLLLAWRGDARAYRVRYAPETIRFTPVLAGLGAFLYETRSAGQSWKFHVRFPSRTAFSAFRSYCSTNGVALTLFRLYRDDSDGGGGELGLTGRQWETLTTAHEMGYFEVPRGTTQEELAARFDVSPSAVSQRIRRATNALLAATLESSELCPRF